MRIIKACPGSTIPLGRQGENLAAQVQFPCVSTYQELYGDGNFQLVAQREGDEIPYPVTVTVDGDTVRWDVTNVDTAVVGYGQAILHYYAGEALAKTVVFETLVANALGAAGDVPDPYETWFQQLLQAAEGVIEAVQETTEQANAAIAAKEAAQEAADDAAQSAEASAGSAGDAAASASAAAQSAESAAQDADRAEQGAATAGYMDFEIDDRGHLIYTRTSNVEVDFALVNGHLVMEVA